MDQAAYAQRIMCAQAALLTAMDGCPAQDTQFWIQHWHQVENVRKRVAGELQEQQAAAKNAADERIAELIRELEYEQQQRQEAEAADDGEGVAEDEQGIIL